MCPLHTRTPTHFTNPWPSQRRQLFSTHRCSWHHLVVWRNEEGGKKKIPASSYIATSQTFGLNVPPWALGGFLHKSFVFGYAGVGRTEQTDKVRLRGADWAQCWRWRDKSTLCSLCWLLHPRCVFSAAPWNINTCVGTPAVSRQKCPGLLLVLLLLLLTLSSSWWTTRALRTSATTAQTSTRPHWTGWRQRGSSLKITTCSRSARHLAVNSWQDGGSFSYQHNKYKKKIFICSICSRKGYVSFSFKCLIC